MLSTDEVSAAVAPPASTKLRLLMLPWIRVDAVIG